MASADDIAFAMYMRQVVTYEVFWFAVIFCSFGFLMNMLSIIVFRRKIFWGTTMGFYNIVIACVNNFAIIFACWLYIPPFFNANATLHSQAECVLINFFQRVFTRLSSWLDVMIVVDRLIRISSPLKHEFMKRPKYLSLIILGLFVCSLAATAQALEYKLVATAIANSTATTVKCSVDKLTLLSINITTIATRVVIPFAIMLVSNIFLIYNLKRVRQERWMRREVSFAWSVIALSGLFFLTHLPYSVFLIWQTVLAYTDIHPLSRMSTIVNAAHTFSLELTSYNYILPAVVNLMFNKLFRDEFRAHFGLW